jgi:hypothetical protein
MRPRRLVAHAVMVLAMLGPSLSLAQDIRIEERPRPEAPQGESSGPSRHDASTPPAAGVPPRVDHAPAFIEPFVGTYETPTTTGQFGLSGWTAPNPMVGPPYREVTGWFSLGFTVTWGPKPPYRSTATP